MSPIRISTKGRYALRLMLDLAASESGGCIALKEIAARQQISVKYMEQIITILNRAGFVHSLRGPQGGYRLSRAPKYYTVGQILRLTEGELAPVACLADSPGQCPRAGCCAAQEVYRRIDQAVSGVVDSITLQDLVLIQREKEREAAQ